MPDSLAHYHVFGGRLASALPFPELAPAPDAPEARPDWTLTLVDRLPAPVGARDAGRDLLQDGVTVRLVRHAAGVRLEYDDTGAFDIRDGGRTIRWERRAGVALEAVRTDFLSRVLALALHEGGVACLHGSAVALGRGAVVFLAPKFHGKSTLATALTRAGGRLLTDDAVAVEPALPGQPPSVRPGVHSVRLWTDSVARVAPETAWIPSTLGKQLLRHLPADRRAEAPVPLAAVHLLVPDAADAPEAVRRERLPAVPAAIAIVRQAKLGALLGGAEAAALFDRAAAIAAAVPVYTLRVARDYGRLDDVVAQLLAWYDAPAATLVEAS